MTAQNPTDAVLDTTGQPVAPIMPDHLKAAIAQAAQLAEQASAPATRAAYKADWADWAAWCAEAGVDPMPALPAALGAYLAERSNTLAISTVTRRLAAICTVHRLAGHHVDTRHPHVRDVLRGLRRTKGVAPKRAKPATTDLVLAMANTCDTATLLGLRDRALLLLGFSSGMRRGELAALAVNDLDFTAAGLKLLIKRSKGDQDGVGETVGVVASNRSTCPVLAVRVWLEAADVAEGPVFRSVSRHGRVGASLSAKAIREVVQRRAELADLGPGLTAHSLRSGMITSAAAKFALEHDIARQSRHKSVVVLRGYIQHATVFRNNVSSLLGL